MHRKFLSNLSLLLLLNLLIKPFYILGIDAEVQNRVGEDEYGLFFALLNLTFLFNILIDMGITNFNNRNIARNTQLIQKQFSKLFVIRLLLGLGYFVFTVSVGTLLGYGEHAIYILLWLSFNQVLVSFILFLRSNLTALHLFVRDSVISVMDRALLIITCGTILWGGVTDQPFQIEWFVYLQSACYGFTFLLALYWVLSHSGKLRLHLDVPFSISILRQSLPFAVFILISFVYNRVDSIMLERLLDRGEFYAGIYAQGYRFFEAANMFAYLFAVLLLPIFSRMLKKREPVYELVGIASRVLLSAAWVFGLATAMFSEQILQWRYDDPDPTSPVAFSWLIISFVAVSGTYIFGTLLTAKGDLRMMNKIAVGGLIINIALNLILIPKFQAPGAAIATFVTQFFVFGGQLISAKSSLKLPANMRLILSFSIFIITSALGIWLAVEYIRPWLVAYLISLVVGIAIAFASGVLNPKLLYRAIAYGD